ncbi:uncharacterized protein LOC128386027 [Panonychus citri]|uniref:uncharacterized protein LOC128386027 n=1 Tax=Panonychus citri TaxID=50023 RepID=UPI0023072607|nr:uncharacterized protein LOC128386027 [Panonychus citri]
MRLPISIVINLLIVITLSSLNCDSASTPPDTNRESLEILKYLQSTMRTMEMRLGNLESKLSSANLADQSVKVNNVQGKVDQLGSSITIIGGKVERMESILNKLQLTDQEKKKWCNTEYGQSLFSVHKTESESIRKQMSSMLQEISELIRSGMGKLLIRMDSLLTESSKSSTNSGSLISSGGNYKPAISSSSTLPTTTTNSRAGFELAGSDESINRGNGDNQVTINFEQLNNKLDTLVGRCSSQPNRGSGDHSNDIMTTLAQFRSLSQDTLNTMVKKIESTENQLLTTIFNSLEVPGKLVQVKDRVEDNVSKLRTQVDGLSSNAPILRILRHIKTQLPDVSRVTCMDDQTSELLEKATSQVNTMIADYTKQIDSIGLSLTNVNTIVSRLASMTEKYKNNSVQSSNSTNLKDSWRSVTPWE